MCQAYQNVECLLIPCKKYSSKVVTLSSGNEVKDHELVFCSVESYLDLPFYVAFLRALGITTQSNFPKQNIHRKAKVSMIREEQNK